MSNIKFQCSCPLLLMHQMLGGKWKMRVLWHIRNRENRFSELKNAMPEISEKVLYTSLRELEMDGILTKEVEKEEKPSIIRYYLSEEYKEIEEIIDAAFRFAENYAKKNKQNPCERLTKK